MVRAHPTKLPNDLRAPPLAEDESVPAAADTGLALGIPADIPALADVPFPLIADRFHEGGQGVPPTVATLVAANTTGETRAVASERATLGIVMRGPVVDVTEQDLPDVAPDQTAADMGAKADAATQTQAAPKVAPVDFGEPAGRWDVANPTSAPNVTTSVARPDDAAQTETHVARPVGMIAPNVTETSDHAARSSGGRSPDGAIARSAHSTAARAIQELPPTQPSATPALAQQTPKPAGAATDSNLGRAADLPDTAQKMTPPRDDAPLSRPELAEAKQVRPEPGAANALRQTGPRPPIDLDQGRIHRAATPVLSPPKTVEIPAQMATTASSPVTTLHPRRVADRTTIATDAVSAAGSDKRPETAANIGPVTLPDPARPIGPPTPVPTPEMPRNVAAQIADVVRRSDSGSLELSLSPEELGRVRVTMHGDRSALSVVLQAERADTLDLLRRHIDVLGTELRRAGYTSVDFSFSSSGGGDNGAAGQGADPLAELRPMVDPPPAPQRSAARRRGASAPGGMDLRV